MLLLQVSRSILSVVPRFLADSVDFSRYSENLGGSDQNRNRVAERGEVPIYARVEEQRHARDEEEDKKREDRDDRLHSSLVAGHCGRPCRARIALNPLTAISTSRSSSTCSRSRSPKSIDISMHARKPRNIIAAQFSAISISDSAGLYEKCTPVSLPVGPRRYSITIVLEP